MSKLRTASLMCLAVLLLCGPVLADWHAIVIRNSSTGVAPEIKANTAYGVNATEFVIALASQKAAWASGDLDGHKVKEIAQIAVTRHDDRTRFTAGSGPYVAPYFNIWITDGAGKFAVIANEPSDAVFTPLYNNGYNLTFADIANKPCKVYENSDKSWLPNNGVGLTFADVAEFTIQAPTPAQLAAGWAGLGTGAPRELGTNVAYGFNWVFGDTLSNYVSGAEGYVMSEPLAVPSSGGFRLVQTQNADGGWGWPLWGSSALNTLGPIAQGLAKAYLQSWDPTMRAALVKSGTLLLSKTNNFSPSDGYLAFQLDMIFGGTTYRDHLTANFYGPLSAGTYNKGGAGILYDTAGYVNLIRTARASQGIANLAAWDVGMGLVAAASCGVSGADLDAWIAGVKAEINELDGEEYYDVLGLAGALYALAFVGEEFDPTSGEHADASCLADLAAILASYQIDGGGFAWNSNYVIPNDNNETIQETAYAILALAQVNPTGYQAAIDGASAYMKSVQLATGGWENYAGEGENNEVTGEALWGISVADAALLVLEASADSLYVKPGETVTIDMNVLDLPVEVKACQAFLGFSSAHLLCTGVVEGGTPWDQLIWGQFTPGGEIDTAVGVLSENPAAGTTADGTVATVTFTALGSFGPSGTGTESATTVVFRADVDDVESTFLVDMAANPVWPTKRNSQRIVIDGVNPIINVASVTQGALDLTVSGNNAVVGTVAIAVTASDGWAGLDGVPTVTVTDSAGNPVAVTFVNESPDGTFNYTATIAADTANGTATIQATVNDLAGNSATDSQTFNVNKHEITGLVQLQGFVGATREVTFVATGGVETKSWTLTLSFTGGVAEYQLVDVPAGTTGLSAKTAWSLRRKLAVSYADDRAVADFTGVSMLRGGDLNGTNSVNTLDYTLLKTKWYTTNAASDINGDGVVNTTDYNIMLTNWFQVGDAQ